MLKVIINNKEAYVSKNCSILEACASVGLEVPKFCYHPKLNIVGNCRMCLVEISKSPKPVSSCSYPVVNGLQIYTNTPLVKKSRENVLEFLLINHPLDCPICDQGGECDLQEQTETFGADKSRFFLNKRQVENKNVGPLIKTVMTRCIHCTKCIRFLSEIGGEKELGTVQRGQQTEIGTYIPKNVKTELSGNIIDLCPVGALTSKPYAFLARPWELKFLESIDLSDAVGSNIEINLKESEIVRILPKLNESINEEWLTDKGRFNFDSLKMLRLCAPYKVSNTNTFMEFSWKKGLLEINNFFFEDTKNIQVLLSTFLDISVFQKLKLLANFLGIRRLVFSRQFLLNLDNVENFSFGSFEDLSKADFVLLIGTNLRFEASSLNLRLKKRLKQGIFAGSTVGNVCDLSYRMPKQGISVETLLSIAEGKHLMCKKLRNSKCPLLVFNTSVCERNDFLGLYKALIMIKRHLLLNHLNWNVLRFLNQEANQTGGFFTGIGVNTRFYKKSKDIKNCFFGLFKKEVFCKSYTSKKALFIGNHPKDVLLDAKMMLPVNHFLEISGAFMNAEGLIQQSAKISAQQGFFRKNEELLHLLITTSGGFKPSKPLLDSFSERLSTSSSIMYFKDPEVIRAGKSLISRVLFRPFFTDFFLSDALSDKSFVMASCSRSYRKMFTNFLSVSE